MARAGVLFEVSVTGCDAETWVNDIPVGRAFGSVGGAVHSCNHVLVHGENTFEVLVNPGSKPSTARSEKRTLPGDGVAVSAHLALCPPGTSPGDPGTTTLFRYDWAAPDGEMEFPHPVATSCALDPPFGPWAWEQAAPLVLDATLRAEVAAYLRSLRQSLSSRSFPAFWAHNEVTHHEVAVAHDLALADRRTAAEGALRERFAEPTFAMEEVDAEALDLRLVARGRLVECLAADWGAAVRTQADGEGRVMRFPLLLGRVDGALRGLR